MNFIIANWKMGGSMSLVQAYLDAFCHPLGAELIIAPGAPYLHPLQELAGGPNIKLSGQDCASLASTNGAYTGETSAAQLRDLNCEYCIIGHSERRQFFLEDAPILRKKLEHAISQGVTPIYCIGETLDAYKGKQTRATLAQQLSVLKGLNPPRLIVAYEPVWAIGSGLVPQPAEIREINDFIIAEIQQNGYVNDHCYLIAYGGSVTAENAATIVKETGIQGILVGSHSLDVARLKGIIQAVVA